MTEHADAPIVLVHGAWHGPWAWDEVVGRLQDAGRTVVTVDLVSSGPDPAALGDLAADAAAVASALDGLDRPAVLVGHSYGGQPISQASAGRDDVAHLVYVCAFMLDVGESLLGAIGGEPAEWTEAIADGAATITLRSDEIFYGDVDPDVAARCVERLQPQSIKSFTDELTGAGWHDIPSTYVIAEQDAAIPPPAQEAMSGRAGAVHRLASSHSPFMSMPDEVVRIIQSI